MYRCSLINSVFKSNDSLALDAQPSVDFDEEGGISDIQVHHGRIVVLDDFFTEQVVLLGGVYLKLLYVIMSAQKQSYV